VPHPPLPDTWLIAGLGNPGPRYARTRHNLGFLVVAALSERFGIPLSRERWEAVFGQGRLGECRVILAAPQTYMNRSGQAVASLLRYFQLSPEALVVIHDDLDLPAGRLKLAWDGGAGGHKGVLSVAAALDTLDFYRVKVGIGRPPAGVPAEAYVLAAPAPEEWQLLEEAAARAALAVEVLVREGLAPAQNRFHGPGAGPEPAGEKGRIKRAAAPRPEEKGDDPQAGG
jgi:PTH1 family peptidyl-tRNA hydrolase